MSAREVQAINHIVRSMVFDLSINNLLLSPIIRNVSPHDSIPYDQMWVDDKLWYPLLLQGKRFNAFFKYIRKVI